MREREADSKPDEEPHDSVTATLTCLHTKTDGSVNYKHTYAQRESYSSQHSTADYRPSACAFLPAQIFKGGNVPILNNIAVQF